MDVINLIDKGIHALKEKDVKTAIESFGNAMAQCGKDLEEEVNWVGERGLELVLRTRSSVFSAAWFYFSLHLGTRGNEQLNYLSQAQGLISLENLILRPVTARVFKNLQEKGKIPSRNLAIEMVALSNGMMELEKLIKNSLKNFIMMPDADDGISKEDDSPESKDVKDEKAED